MEKKRERVRETMDQTLRPRYVSRFEHLALHPHLHHRVGFPIHYLPPREPLPKRICYNSRSTKLLSQTTTSQPRGRPLAKQPTPLPKRVTTTKLHITQEGANTNLHLYQRGSKLQSQYNNLNLYQRGSNQQMRVFTTSGISQPQTSPFHKTKILNRLG